MSVMSRYVITRHEFENLPQFAFSFFASMPACLLFISYVHHCTSASFSAPSCQSVGPVECARRGWENVDVDMLACTACRAHIMFVMPHTQSLSTRKNSNFAGPCITGNLPVVKEGNNMNLS